MDEQTAPASVAGGVAPACSRGFDVFLAPADKDISRNAKALGEPSDHVQRQRELVREHFVHTLDRADLAA